MVTLQAYTASLHNGEIRRKNSAAKAGNEEFLRNGFDITTCDADDSRKDADARKAESLRGIFEAARDRCRFFENRFSRTLSRSDISRLNNADGAWVKLQGNVRTAAAFVALLRESGVFDITMGSAAPVGFSSGRTLVKKTRRALTRGLAHDCSAHEELNPRNDIAADHASQADLRHPRRRNRQGYIADDLGKLLQDNSLSSYVINLGGNVLAHGSKPQGGPWRVGIQDPRASRESGSILGAVPLENASAVTSGTYERYFMHNERAYHHILDPKTGYPVQTDLAGATVTLAHRLMPKDIRRHCLPLAKTQPSSSYARMRQSLRPILSMTKGEFRCYERLTVAGTQPAQPPHKRS
ncbi:MAG: FAD:protein FMN transferase [Eggerthellaceae bacterium]